MERDSKREHHNALERNRRNHIKDNFERLKEALPMLAGEKASRSVVLNHATSFVETSNLENETLKKTVDILASEVDFLDSQLEYIDQCINEGSTPVISPDLIHLINTYNNSATHLTSIANNNSSTLNSSSHTSSNLNNLPPLQTVHQHEVPKQEKKDEEDVL